MTKITLSGPLRPKEASDTIETDTKDVYSALTELVGKYPELEKKLFKDGAVTRFVAVYLNDEDIRFCEGLKTPLKDGDTISIVSAVSGG